MTERFFKVSKSPRDNNIILKHMPSGRIMMLPEDELDDILEDIKNLR